MGQQPNPQSSIYCISWPQTCCGSRATDCPTIADTWWFWAALAAVLLIPKKGSAK